MMGRDEESRRGRYLRIYEALLMIYPRQFRERYGQEMTRLFDDRYREARSLGTRSSLWIATIWDVIRNGVSERARKVRNHYARRESVRPGERMGMSFDGRRTAGAHGRTTITVSVLTLALGIGASTAIFSVVHGVLLKPLPYDEPDALVALWHSAPGLGFTTISYSPALHFTYRDESRVFDDVGLFRNGLADVSGGDEPERVPSMQVSHGTLSLLRVSPVLGRIFDSEDDSFGAPETVVISFGYWQRRFGGDLDVLGRTVTVDGRPHSIIGVLGEGFRFLRWEADLYLPLQFDPSELFLGNFSYLGIARLAAGVTIEQANADVDRMIPLAGERYGFAPGMSMATFREAGFRGNIRPLKEEVVGTVQPTLWIVFGTVGIVLLIACANVANLYLVRAEGRKREFALRNALGADRSHIAKELLHESLKLGALGGLAGLGIAFIGLRALLAQAPDSLPRQEAIDIDLTVLAFTFVISLGAGLLFSILPVLKYTKPRLVDALKDGGRGASDGKERNHARGALVVAQVALAVVLLVASGLMVRSLHELRAVEPGFMDPAKVLTFRVTIPETRLPDASSVARAHEEMLRAVRAIPGVRSAALTSSVTMDGFRSTDSVFVEEFPLEGARLPPMRRFKLIGPGYHETMGNPLKAGRSLTWDDVHRSAPVVIVTENFAVEYWDSAENAIGKRVRANPSGRWREIVGVVGDVHDNGVHREATPVMFWPLSTPDLYEENGAFVRRNLAYVVRSDRVGEAAFLRELREAIWSFHPDVPVATVRTLDAILDDSMSRTAFTLVMLGIAAAVALAIGAVGLYGVISYGVTQRTREIGVRMALGARRAAVVGLFMRQAAWMSFMGVIVGVAVAVGLTRLMNSMLFGVSPTDPLTYGIVPLVLIGVALGASYLPARRASGIAPTVALRWE